jgi:hypothetical protein
MESAFTIPYSEYCVAIHLQDLFKPKDGYSLFIPMSRQEKGVDLLLAKRQDEHIVSITIQVKASRTYSPKPTKSGNSLRFRYYTWFNNFDVPKEADYIFLTGLYPPEEGRTKKSASSWWSVVILAFTQAEMITFISNIKTRKGTRDKMFGFGFDEPTKIYQTRGDMNPRKDYSSYLLRNRVEAINTKFWIK